MSNTAILALEDGTIFRGTSVGAEGQTTGEVVFNTAMTGYQEILTDPSYARQIVTLTYPHIGNTGVTSEDAESSGVHAAGLVIRDLPLVASSWRSEQSLSNYLSGEGVVAIADIDTRKLTRILRDKGALSGCIVAGEDPDVDAALAQARGFSGLVGMDLAKEVTTQAPYTWEEGSWQWGGDQRPAPSSNFSVVALDFGVKRNILRMLVDRGCSLTVLPAESDIETVCAYVPDGIFLSNGPGDPEPLFSAKQVAKDILNENKPLFGICLGHQVIALANGISTYKMFNGHRGINHPVKNMITGKGEITSQNHGFAVNKEELEAHADLELTHFHLNDNTVAGMRSKSKNCFSVQYHPEASPGPHDSAYLFDQFIANIEASKN